MSCTAGTWRSRAAPRPQARRRQSSRKKKGRAWRPFGFTDAAPLADRVRDVALVGVVRPGALHGVRAIAHAHVRGRSLAGADPRALTAILLAGGGGAAAAGILSGLPLAVFLAVHDGEAMVQAR